MDPVVGCNLISVKSFILTESRVACHAVFAYIVTDDYNLFVSVAPCMCFCEMHYYTDYTLA